MTVRLRDDYSALDLRRLARTAMTAAASRRMLSLALVVEGAKRAEAAKAGGMDRQTLRDWVHRFNAEGPEGLYDKRGPGPACRLSEQQQQELAALIEAGPDLAKHGVVRFRLCDLCALVEKRFGVSYHEQGLSKLIKRLGFRRISNCPFILPMSDRSWTFVTAGILILAVRFVFARSVITPTAAM